MSATGQSDNAIQYTFGGPNPLPDEATLRAAAGITEPISAEDQILTEDDPISTPDPVETQPVEPATPPIEAAKSTSEPTASLDEPKVHKITVDGQELLVTEKDLLEGHMRHRDYTQKTQRLSAREKELTLKEQTYQQELSTIDQFLRDKQAVAAYMEKAFGPAQPNLPVPQVDPNQPITASQVAEIARYNAEQVRLATQQDMDAKLAGVYRQNQQAALDIQREKLGTAIDQHVSALLDQHPILRKFDGIEEVLIADAQKGDPIKSFDEAKTRLTDAASRRAAIIKALGDESKKEAAVKAAALKKNSPEPPGGTAPASLKGKKTTLAYKDTNDRIAGGVELIQQYLSNHNT